VWVERWLRTSNRGGTHKVEETVRRLLKHIAWRFEYSVDGILEEDWGPHDKRDEMFVSGLDRHQRPSVTWRVAKHDAKLPVGQTPQLGARYLVCTIERARAVNPASRHIVFICDCSGLQWKNFEHAMFIEAVGMLQENYPDNLAHCIIFPVGWLVSSLFNICRPLLDKNTSDKMAFLTEETMHKSLREHFADDEIEVRLGGSLDLRTARTRRVAEEDYRGGCSSWEDRDRCGVARVWKYRDMTELQRSFVPPEHHALLNLTPNRLASKRARDITDRLSGSSPSTPAASVHSRSFRTALDLLAASDTVGDGMCEHDSSSTSWREDNAVNGHNGRAMSPTSRGAKELTCVSLARAPEPTRTSRIDAGARGLLEPTPSTPRSAFCSGQVAEAGLARGLGFGGCSGGFQGLAPTLPALPGMHGGGTVCGGMEIAGGGSAASAAESVGGSKVRAVGGAAVRAAADVKADERMEAAGSALGEEGAVWEGFGAGGNASWRAASGTGRVGVGRLFSGGGNGVQGVGGGDGRRDAADASEVGEVQRARGNARDGSWLVVTGGARRLVGTQRLPLYPCPVPYPFLPSLSPSGRCDPLAHVQPRP
jgi:hypothetical protein